MKQRFCRHFWIRAAAAGLIGLCLVVVAIGLGGWWLIVDQADGDCTHGLVLIFERSPEFAAQWSMRDRPRQLLFVTQEPDRLEQAGAWPSPAEVIRNALAAQGVPRDAFEVIPSDSRTDWQVFRRLGTWMDQHPGARVSILTTQFDTTRTRYIIDHVLTRQQARRVAVVAVPDHRADASNWWRRRTGWKLVGNGWLRLLFAYCYGEGEVPERPLDPEAYEQKVREMADGSDPEADQSE